MGKFSFPVPGRKKQAPQVTVTEPTNKAHKILGSGPLSIDGRKNWDGRSAVSVNVAEASPSSFGGSSWSGGGRSESQWGDESDGQPPHLRSGAVIGYDLDDGRTEAHGTLRTRQSSSTIKSWYDKSAQSLSLSHQSSSSAVTTGLSKAQRMLDMDHSHNTIQSKKKPKKLDLGLGRSRNSKLGTYDQYENVMRSPSLVSPGSGSSRAHRRLQKRPTQESMRSDIGEGYRPGTSDSSIGGRGHNRSNSGLHNLYDHYEQMSLRQLMDLDTHNHDFSADQQIQDDLPQINQPVHYSARSLPTHQEELEPTLEPVLDLLHIQPPRTAQTDTSASVPSEKASSADYATSISSRHTRTSRASKRTDQSMQETDLQEKSVLLLSSDSEDDTDIEVPMRSPAASVATRRPSTIEDEHASFDGFYMLTGPQAPAGMDRRTSRSSKRTNFAPAKAYLHPSSSPTGPLPKSPSTDSRGSLPFIHPLNAPMSPSGGSMMSNSSVGTAATWQNRPGYGVQEARAMTILPAKGPSEADESEHDTEPHADSSQTDTGAFANSATASGDQPTPPMSPSSVEFYLRSGHSSIDGPGSQNRIMAVSRQEELLLGALRQKRQDMREAPITEDEELPLPRTKRESSRSHRSKTSEATITGSAFDFDFPAPPRHRITNDLGPALPVTDRRESTGTDRASYARDSTDSGSILAPAPIRPLPPKGILKNPGQEQSEQSHERILLYLDRPVSPGVSPLEESEPSPDLIDYIEFEEPASNNGRRASANLIQAPEVTRPRDSSNGRRISEVTMQPPTTYRPILRPDFAKTARIAEEVEVEPETDSDDDRSDANDVPRPDSPISPDSFPAVPPARMTLNKLARLSAVGPGTLGAEPGWWGDSD